jgi:hypothetical protein
MALDEARRRKSEGVFAVYDSQVAALFWASLAGWQPFEDIDDLELLGLYDGCVVTQHPFKAAPAKGRV